MAGDQHRPPPPAPPPRSLVVQRFASARAPELVSLHSLLSERLGSDFRIPRHKRRRTTSFFNPKSSSSSSSKQAKKKRKVENRIQDAVEGDVEEKKEVKLSRRVRRRMEFKGNPVLGFGVCRDGTKRLRTHVWNAKRFQMEKIWGFYLPLGLSGSGKGSRSILKQLKHGTLIHDASYYAAVQLEGTEECLVTVLNKVLTPAPPISEESSSGVLCGVCCGKSVLHQPESYSQAIAPVTYMWRPILKDHVHFNAAGENKEQELEVSKLHRQLWIWIHPAAFAEGFDALRVACQRQIDVSCISREGELGMLDIMGSNVSQAIKRLLKPLLEDRPPELDTGVDSGHAGRSCLKSLALEQMEILPSGTVLSLAVLDPRTILGNECQSSSKANEDDPGEHMVSSKGDILKSDASYSALEELSCMWRNPKKNSVFFSDRKELWDLDANDMISPVEESVICAEKHQNRLALLFMSKKNPSPSAGTNTVSIRSCPVLLLKNNNKKGSSSVWSIVLPISWIKPFWNSLILHGSHAIGLRERHWIANDAGLPSFPCDFPDCVAYARHMASVASALEEVSALRPWNKRPLPVPIPPPWDCIRHSRVESIEESENQKIDMLASSVATSIKPVDTEVATTLNLHDGSSSMLVIARTCQALVDQKAATNKGHLLSVNNGSEHSCQEISLGMIGGHNVPASKKSCLVRVLIYAHRTGFFEEGAVVCAPVSDDYRLWSSRPGGAEGLEIPTSLVNSYFVQTASSWKLQIPNDTELRQLHRWPVGFVTTGFVRGSKVLVAQAICDYASLTQLREEQRGRKHPIKVLVRNLSSSAYRPGMASIVLETQNEDLDFM